MRINLSEFVTLPKLVDKKVCIVDEATNAYQLVPVGMYTQIADDFDPIHYSLLCTRKYVCIVHAKRSEIQDVLVTKLYTDMKVKAGEMNQEEVLGVKLKSDILIPRYDGRL